MSDFAGVIRLRGQPYAAGLFWQPAPSASAATREARRVAAKPEVGADLYCVRRRGAPQYGLGTRKSGHRSGMPAIAAHLACAFGRKSWIGVFACESRWLLLLVRDGLILPDGDILLVSERDANDRFQAELLSTQWDKLLCPSAWNVPGSEFGDLQLLLGGRVDARLKRVDMGVTSMVFRGLMVCLSGLGLWWLAGPKSTVPVPDVAPPPVVPPPPWEGQPVPATLIESCAAAMARIPEVAGFDIAEIRCDREGTEANYHRRSGSLDWLPNDFQIRSADHVSHVTPWSSPLRARSFAETPWTADAFRRRLWGAAQTYALDSEIADTTARTTTARHAAAPDHLREVSLMLSGRLGPDVFVHIIGGIPALVVDEVSWRSAGWTVRGKVYVR